MDPCLGQQGEVLPIVKGLFYSSFGPCYIELDCEESQSLSTSFPSSTTAVANEAGHSSAKQWQQQLLLSELKGLSQLEVHRDHFLSAVKHSAVEMGEGETKILTSQTVVSKNITTVMMHGLPPGPSGTPFVASWLCEMNLQDHCDYIYTPYDIKTDTNHGYAFINLSCVEAAAALVALATGEHLMGHNQEVHFLPADIQGAEALVKKMVQRKLHCIRNPQLRPYIARELLSKDWMQKVNAHRKQLLACTTFP